MSTVFFAGIVCPLIVVILLAMGIPVAFALMLTGVLGLVVTGSLQQALTAIGLISYSSVASWLLTCVPLFILMGHLAFAGGLADKAYYVAYRWIGRVRAGLAMASAVACGIFAATTGVTGATYTEKSYYFTAQSGQTSVSLIFRASAAGTVYLDDVSLKEVTDVGTDGVHIVSERNGTTRNWTYIDASFDYDDSAYTFEVLRCNHWPDIVALEEIRGIGVKVQKNDPIDGTTFIMRGKLTDYTLEPGIFKISIEMRDDDILKTLLPLGVVTTDTFDATALDVGTVINLCFGKCRDVPLRNVKNDTGADHYDYLIGYGTIEGLWTDAGLGVKRGGTLVNTAEYTLYDGSQGTPYPGYAFLRFTVKEQINFSGGYHKLTADVNGLEMGGATANRNFAVTKKNILSDTTWGLSDSIDTTSFANAAAALDTIGDMYCDGAITQQMEASQIIDKLLELSRSTMERSSDGEWEITVDVAGVSIKTFYDGINCEVISLGCTPTPAAIKKAILQYAYNQSEQDKPYYEMELEVNSFGEDRIFTAPFVYEHDTAERVLSYKKNRSIYSDKPLKIRTDMDGRQLSSGDIITLTAFRFNVVSQTFKIQEARKTLTHFIYDVRSHSGNIYDNEVIVSPTNWTGGTDIIKGPNAMVGEVVLGDGDTRPGTLTLQVAAGQGDTWIAAGKTDFTNAQNGFILGIDDSDSDRPKFYIGNATDYLNWTGLALVVSGQITTLAGSSVDGGHLVALSVDTAQIAANAITTVKIDADAVTANEIAANVINAGHIKGTAFGTLTISSGKIAIQTTDGLEIKSGGNVEIESGGEFKLLAGGDLRLIGDAGNPSQIIWDGTSYDFTWATSANGAVFSAIPSHDGQIQVWWGNSSYRLTNMYVYLDSTFQVEGAGDVVALKGASGTGGIFSSDSMIHDIGTAPWAFDEAYADNWNNVADIPFLDNLDDVSIIKGIKNSGVIDPKTGFEMIDDDTLPDVLLVKEKMDREYIRTIHPKEGEYFYPYEQRFKTVKKGDIARTADGKPYVSSKTMDGLLMGAVRQLAARIAFLEKAM